MTDRTPTTEAGRRLVRWSDGRGGGYVSVDEVLAIEDEARAPLVAALEAASLALMDANASLSRASIALDVAAERLSREARP